MNVMQGGSFYIRHSRKGQRDAAGDDDEAIDDTTPKRLLRHYFHGSHLEPAASHHEWIVVPALVGRHAAMVL